MTSRGILLRCFSRILLPARRRARPLRFGTGTGYGSLGARPLRSGTAPVTGLTVSNLSQSETQFRG